MFTAKTTTASNDQIIYSKQQKKPTKKSKKEKERNKKKPTKKKGKEEEICIKKGKANVAEWMSCGDLYPRARKTVTDLTNVTRSLLCDSNQPLGR